MTSLRPSFIAFSSSHTHPYIMNVAYNLGEVKREGSEEIGREGNEEMEGREMRRERGRGGREVRREGGREVRR